MNRTAGILLGITGAAIIILVVVATWFSPKDLSTEIAKSALQVIVVVVLG